MKMVSGRRTQFVSPVFHVKHWRAFDSYLAVLDAWRERINLIGPGEGRHLWRRHVLDSACSCIEQISSDDLKVADLGSGAGFPGLVIACALAERPGASVTLVEKSPRKSEFLEAAIAEVGLPARVLNTRIEDPPPRWQGSIRPADGPGAGPAAQASGVWLRMA